jgi:hypothetical protein
MKMKLLLLLLVIPFGAISQTKNFTKMTYVLKNRNLEIQIDSPLANYNFSRFDWTGKIVSVTYKNIPVSGVEKLTGQDNTDSGQGFYNEFGITAAVGYDETSAGEWFQKIGVGLLKKDSGEYQFYKKYEIQPASFHVTEMKDKIIISCKSQNVNGYAYELAKEIKLLEKGFVISYHLKNTGGKTINTDEYTHNFIAINKELVGVDYRLKFPFSMNPEKFEGNVNPEQKVDIGSDTFTFNGTPEKQFFFGNLTAGQSVDASWEIINTKTGIGISETGSFKTNKINLWGWKQVISPELFFSIRLEPGKEMEWSRTYSIFETHR